MSLQASEPADKVLYAGHRNLRELGHSDPGISFSRDAMRELNLLDESGVEDDHQVFVTIYESGRVVVDLQVEQ